MAKLMVYFSAMSGGKTTTLLQAAYNYNLKDQKCLIIKPKVDTKGDDKIVSRLGLERKVDILLDNNESIYDDKYREEIYAADVILVDEAQFLTEKQVMTFGSWLN